MDEGGLRYEWPITLTTPGARPTVTAANDKITNISVHENYHAKQKNLEQILSFEDGTMGRKLLQTLHNIVTIAVVMFITWLLKKVFSDLSKNQPFSIENATRIKWIAFTVMFLSLFDVVEAFLSRLYTGSTITITGARLYWYDYSFDFKTFLLGFLLLIIADVFKRGAEYKADSESFV
jgi:hypothetical protein